MFPPTLSSMYRHNRPFGVGYLVVLCYAVTEALLSLLKEGSSVSLTPA